MLFKTTTFSMRSNFQNRFYPFLQKQTYELLVIRRRYVGNWILDCAVPKLDTKQFGAIRGRSTTHALVGMLHMWHKALDQSEVATPGSRLLISQRPLTV